MWPAGCVLFQAWMKGSYDPCTESHSTVYYNRPDVQRARHANVTGINYTWVTCRFVPTLMAKLMHTCMTGRAKCLSPDCDRFDYSDRHGSYMCGLSSATLGSCMYGRCLFVLFHMIRSDPLYDHWGDSPRSMLPIYKELIAAGLRIWVFRSVPCTMVCLNLASCAISSLLRF
jgi:serine carboxypeptidase-like clade 2